MVWKAKGDLMISGINFPISGIISRIQKIIPRYPEMVSRYREMISGYRNDFPISGNSFISRYREILISGNYGLDLVLYVCRSEL